MLSEENSHFVDDRTQPIEAILSHPKFPPSNDLQTFRKWAGQETDALIKVIRQRYKKDPPADRRMMEVDLQLLSGVVQELIGIVQDIVEGLEKCNKDIAEFKAKLGGHRSISVQAAKGFLEHAHFDGAKQPAGGAADQAYEQLIKDSQPGDTVFRAVQLIPAIIRLRKRCINGIVEPAEGPFFGDTRLETEFAPDW